ncbi:MAG: hypothetical protein J0L92_30585 [Deltaproteobacteria bacterium]|nr:hypothetical protein [Deltaproteobacteria bacterium]
MSKYERVSYDVTPRGEQWAAESLSGSSAVEYILVDHDAATAAPRARRVLGVPRSALEARGPDGLLYSTQGRRRVRPGLAVAGNGASQRVFMTVVVAGELTEDVSLVVGSLDIDGRDVVFHETDRVRMPQVGTDWPGRPTVYESVPLAWNPRIDRLLVMATIGEWTATFYAVTSGGVFVSRSGTEWFGATSENPHSGNLIAVHPVTGHVYFQTAHNSVTATVGADQSIRNIWLDPFLPDGEGHPPESWPLPITPIRRFLRWCGAPCTLLEWEFQRCGPDFQPSFVSRRFDREDEGEIVWQRYMAGTLGRTRGAFLSGGNDSGCGFHRIVPVGHGASAYIFITASVSACFISVAFVEEGAWPGLD